MENYSCQIFFSLPISSLLSAAFSVICFYLTMSFLFFHQFIFILLVLVGSRICFVLVFFLLVHSKYASIGRILLWWLTFVFISTCNRPLWVFCFGRLFSLTMFTNDKYLLQDKKNTYPGEMLRFRSILRFHGYKYFFLY